MARRFRKHPKKMKEELFGLGPNRGKKIATSNHRRLMLKAFKWIMLLEGAIGEEGIS